MTEVLFLVHRIPYPPTKGDKIRAFNVLKWLSSRYSVHLGAFVDEADDWKHVAALKAFCAEMCLRPLKPAIARLRSLKGFGTGEPLTFPYYRDPEMREWVDGLLREHPIQAVVAFSACMAQYAQRADHVRRVVDFVDLDSDKWRQFAAMRAWPWSWVYGREARKLAQGEARIAGEFDVSIFVSRAEAELFGQTNPTLAARISTVKNGVDTGFFSPPMRGKSPYASGSSVLVFTGAMDYWPNVDAVTWFTREVFPLVRKRVTDAELYIVGARPARSVRALAKTPGVCVVGKTADVRPYIGHARAAVAPLRVARGVQNKVLEAMAMAKPVLMTPAARQGLEPDAVCDSLTARDSREMVEHAIVLLSEPMLPTLGQQCRRYVQRYYDWNRNLEEIGAFIEPVAGRPAQSQQRSKIPA